MTRRPRTPVFWPRMKVRGAYRKWLTAQRIETLTIIPHAVPTVESGTEVKAGYRFATTFRACAPGTPGAMRLEFRTWRDGWGRPARRPQ